MGNGCGPEKWPDWFKVMLFNWFFEASCNKHDEGYTEGGDEARRKVCDDKFLAAMKRDVKRLPFWKRPVARITMWSFYGVVRRYGKSNFNYIKQGFK